MQNVADPLITAKAEQLVKMRAKARKRREELLDKLSSLNAGAAQNELAVLDIFSGPVQRQILALVEELEGRESKDYTDPSHMAESGEE